MKTSQPIASWNLNYNKSLRKTSHSTAWNGRGTIIYILTNSK
ncbi:MULTISPECIES: hypothetical protein [unclassified Chryseobacterium]|nr:MULTISPECIES: hypothetical protein [unclassified Chryseobacterium]